ncbi:MAG: hypothetical protein J3K34DRAFT_81959 [Monoraphidium minutum]|nr:MAG: hypothetical protein J3K34DRAFT_81959 [Monoraphidium minutum]
MIRAAGILLSSRSPHSLEERCCARASPTVAARACGRAAAPSLRRVGRAPASSSARGLWWPTLPGLAPPGASGGMLVACAGTSSGAGGGGSSRGSGSSNSDGGRGRGRGSGRSSSGSGRGRSGGRGAQGSGRGPSTKWLTSLVQEAPDLAALEQLEAQHGGSFNFIHAAAAFTRAGHLAAAHRAPAAVHPLMRRLWQRLQPQLSQCSTWALANIVWACGKVGFAEAPLLDACMAQLCASSVDMNSKDAANALYAAALLNNGGYRIGEWQALQLVAAVVQRWQEADRQSIANVLWAAATLELPLAKHEWEQLLAALAAQAQRLVPQDVSNTLWAAAKRKAEFAVAVAGDVTAVEVALLQLAAAVGGEQVAGITPQQVSNSLWALSELRLRPQGRRRCWQRRRCGRRQP